MKVHTENPSGRHRTQSLNHDLLQVPVRFGVLCRTPLPAESTGDEEFPDAQLNLCLNRDKSYINERKVIKVQMNAKTTKSASQHFFSLPVSLQIPTQKDLVFLGEWGGRSKRPEYAYWAQKSVVYA
ncbi:uncharacterized [Tachysurus ichikawai]